MDAIKIYKEIESDTINIEGLEKFKGKRAEIIILVDDDYSIEKNRSKKEAAFKIINEYSGRIEKWTREELYER